MTLDPLEFLRRFCLHILPAGFVRLRHYGLHANALKAKALAVARRALGVPARAPGPKRSRAERIRTLIENRLGHALDDCPDCGAVASLVRILIPPTARAPPIIPFRYAAI